MNQHEYTIIPDIYTGLGYASQSSLNKYLSETKRKVLGFERARRGNDRYWVIKLMKDKA